MFRRNISPATLLSKNEAKHETSMKLETIVTFSWILKIRAIYSSESWVHLHKMGLSYIPEDTTL
jgi:hypothetical protein